MFDRKVYRRKYYEEHKLWENFTKKELRHRKGINKKYNALTTGIYAKSIKKSKIEHATEMRIWRKNNPECAKRQRQAYRQNSKNAGKLTVIIIQEVYEDNIKRYGTLTCYLCEKPIKFGNDHLEHKTPLSRGGTNDYKNLAVSCEICNCRKHNKTEKEYRNFAKKEANFNG